MVPVHVYFDTSAVVAILQKEKGYRRALEIWETCERPCSSLLLKVEAMTSLRRNFLAMPGEQRSTLESRVSGLRKMLDMMVLAPVEDRIAEIVEREASLAASRSLDALHLATVLYFQEKVWEPVAVCTYDVRMVEAARALDLEILPA